PQGEPVGSTAPSTACPFSDTRTFLCATTGRERPRRALRPRLGVQPHVLGAAVQALRDRYTVVTVDLRGHGESARPPTGYTVGAMVGDLERLVRALAVPGVALVGWSMGGVLA